MKKIYGMLVIAGMLLATVPFLAMADPIDECPIAGVDPDAVAIEEEFFQQIEKRPLDADDEAPTTDCQPDYVKIRGIWGHSGDNEPDGYFGGRITRRERVGVFKGVYNTTGSDNKTRFALLMKKGYFNGKIITDEGKYSITGLYKIDQEKNLLKLRWMTAHAEGWAVARMLLPD